MEHLNRKAEFMGRVTASVTHEIQNVLAIIKETSGLMEDFFLMSRQGSVSNIEEKIDKCLKTIKGQTYRGVGLTSALNGFAHTADHILVSIDVFDTAKKLIAITERLFRQRNLTVLINDSLKPVSIITDPVLFQMVLFSSIECLADSFKAETMSMTVDVRSSEKATGVEIRYDESMPVLEDFQQKMTQKPQWKQICGICDQIDLTAEAAVGTPGIFISLK